MKKNEATVLGSLVEDYLVDRKAVKGLDQKSFNAYRTDLIQFGDFLQKQGLGAPEELDLKHLQSFLELLNSKYKYSSIKRKLASLAGFFKYLSGKNVVHPNPMDHLEFNVHEKRPVPKIINRADLNRLFKIAYGEKESCHKSSREYAFAVRDLAILEVLFATGMRVSELCSLKPAHVDTLAGTITIPGKGTNERVVPLVCSSAVAVLVELKELFQRSIDEHDAILFSQNLKPLGDQAVRLILKALTKSAGIKETVTPHMFRHTMATLLLEKGVGIRKIKEFLGHSSLAVTEVYNQIDMGPTIKGAREYYPRINQAKALG